MSAENPKTELIEETLEKPTQNLSENFRTKRKNNLEKQDEKTRAGLRDLFNRYQSGTERIKAIRSRLESTSHLLTDEQKQYLFSSIEQIANITDENEFVEKMFPVAQNYLGIKADNLDRFEIEDRKRMYDEHPAYKELNQLFAYELEDNEIHLHVPANEGTSIKDKLQLINQGLIKLAEIVRQNPNIKMVVGRSWIVGKNPKLMERLGSVFQRSRLVPRESKSVLLQFREKNY